MASKSPQKTLQAPPTPPRYVSLAQMQAALRKLGFIMVGVRPNSGFDGATVWKHPARPSIEFTVSDPDVDQRGRQVYAMATAMEIWSRANMFANGQRDNDGVRIEIEPTG